ncbi:MAG TPA: TetR family transcriptional regulator [Acidimicrobiales bacterium]|jgi:AcrR family transcriptional regulator|nr:TetR family transcriptional regulator [Acidimicrobiales bacterium]
MPAQQPAPDAVIVGLGDYAGAVATTDGRVPGERGRQTRQRLLDATVELLTTTSWRSVKVTDIARQARTSPATFYQYFGNVEQAIRVLAEGMVDQAAQLAELVGGDWSPEASWDTARAVAEGFLSYWEDNRAVFRVVDLATEEGDAELRGIRVRALNAVTVALAQVIVAASPSGEGAPGTATSSPAGADPMAVAGTLVAMFASVSAHRYGFEFWGIRTRHLIDTQARVLHWAATGREAPAGEPLPRGSIRPRTGPVLGGATARRRSGAGAGSAGGAGGGAGGPGPT